MTRLPILLCLAGSLAGCSSLHEVGKEPVLSPVGYGVDPTATGATTTGYPTAPAQPPTRNSLWNDRQSALFTDARALVPGDILTVLISLNDKASFHNDSDRSRTTKRKFGADGTFDFRGINPSASAEANLDHTTSSSGSGETTRSENIKLTVAAVVTDVLPNGNLVIRGSQEVRVNAELRILTVAGIVRPKDIQGSNTISYERIAEARISYGGRGRLTEVQQPPWGQQIVDTVFPF